MTFERKKRKLSMDDSKSTDSIAVVSNDTRTPNDPKKASDNYLNCFWELVSSDNETRIKASLSILNHLQENNSTEEIDYALKRLIRGLASSRDCARQGFSATLSGMLRQFSPSVLSLEKVLSLLHETMEISKSGMKGMEQREMNFGRFFGYMAIDQSGRLSSNLNIATEILKHLVELASWKKWIREACYESILTILFKLQISLDYFTESILPFLIPHLSTCGVEKDISVSRPEHILLASGLQYYLIRFSKEDETNVEKVGSLFETYPSLNLVGSGRMKALVETMKSSSICYPRIHSSWIYIFTIIFNLESPFRLISSQNQTPGKINNELLQETWNILIEDMLGVHSTHERRGVALKIFSDICLPLLSGSEKQSQILKELLTPSLVHCLYSNGNSASTSNYLFKISNDVMAKFRSFAPSVFKQFMTHQFADPLHSIGHSPEENSMDVAVEDEEELKEILQKKADNVRIWAMDNLVKLMRSIVVEVTLSEKKTQCYKYLLEDILDFFVVNGLFESNKSERPKKSKKNKRRRKNSVENGNGSNIDCVISELIECDPPVSESVQDACQRKLLNLFHSVRKQSNVAATSDSADLEIVLVLQFYSKWKSAETEFSSRIKARQSLNADQVLVRQQVTDLVGKISKNSASSTQNQVDAAFVKLLLHVGMQLVDPSQRDETCLLLQDLFECYKQLKKTSTTTKKKEDDDMKVLIDMLLSILSQGSNLLRDIVKQVFRAVMHDLTPFCIAYMLDIVTSNQSPLEDVVDDDDDEFEPIQPETEKAESSESPVSEGEIEIAAEGDSGMLVKMLDEDEALSAFVSQIQMKKKNKDKLKREVLQNVHFKLRVVELFEILITCPNEVEDVPEKRRFLVGLDIMSGLFNFAITAQRSKENAVLLDRINSVLKRKNVYKPKFSLNTVSKSVSSKKKSKGKKIDDKEHTEIFSCYSDVPESTIPLKCCTILKKCAETVLTSGSGSKEEGQLSAAVYCYIFRVLNLTETRGQSVLDGIIAVFASIVDDCFPLSKNKKKKFNVQFFKDISHRFPEAFFLCVGEALASKVLEVKLDDFTKCEVFSLLTSLLKQLKEDSQAAFSIGIYEKLEEAFFLALKQSMKSKRAKLVAAFGHTYIKLRRAMNSNVVSEKLQFDSLSFAGKLKEIPVDTNPAIKNMVLAMLDALSKENNKAVFKSKNSKKKSNKRKSIE